MRYEKKQISKDDGRYLVYYHFPDSATEEQTSVFRSVDDAPLAASAPHAADPPALNLTDSSNTDISNKDKPSV
jgi:hypothetical protein